MIAKYNGTCYACKKPTEAHVDNYDVKTKKSWHAACLEVQQPSPDTRTLADSLGFIDGELLDRLQPFTVPPAWRGTRRLF